MTVDLPGEEEKGTLARLVDRSGRATGVQLPSAFARGGPGLAPPPPLARLVNGGRSNEARLRLYLSTALLAGSAKRHPVHGRNAIFNVSGPMWARALGLRDPDVAGAQRIANAQRWLHDEGYVDLTRRPGSDPLVRLLSADLTKGRWHRPTSRYLRVPLGLWSSHWLWFMSARELAIFLCLLDFQGGRDEPGRPKLHWMTPQERQRYGFSSETWRGAVARLDAMGLVETAHATAEARDFEARRRRRSYRAVVERLEVDAFEALGTTARWWS